MFQAPAIPFGNRLIGADNPCIIIAEVGINHEGDPAACARMIEEAAKAGVDAVKLQTADPDEHYLPGTESHKLYSRAALSLEQTAEMFRFGKSLGVEMFTTCGDPPTQVFIESLAPAAHKISSGMLGNLPMIRRFARSGLPLILSSGMAELAQVDAAVDAARQAGARHMAIMQCVSLYPADPELLNLRVIRSFEERYGIPAGLSDHTLGCEVAPLAVAAGGHVIEKHFTLDRARPDFDHRISLEPPEMAAMVHAVRRTERIMGRAEKTLSAPEQEIASKFRRRLVARRDIPAGKALEEIDLAIMRSPVGVDGIPSVEYDAMIGRKTRTEIKRYTVIQQSDLV